MKKKILLTLCFFVLNLSYSQKELWGYKAANDGLIIKAPLEGTNHDPDVVYTFDATGILGKFPKGRLLEASNGKLYGITAYVVNPGPEIPLGILFEYDPVLNTYRALNNDIIIGVNGNLFGLIEPVPGLLYGVTNGGRSIFKYNIETEEASIVATIPSFNYNNSPLYPRLNGELMLASDGNLYGITSMAPSSQNIPYPGGIYKYNMITGQLTKIYVFGSNGSDVMEPIYGTKLIEGQPGKLYGTSLGGTHIGPQGVAPSGSGTLFEYTLATNTMVKKFDFDYATIGSNPGPLIKSDNKLYGVLEGLPINSQNHPNADGSIFEYNLDTQTLTVLHAFDYFTDDQVMTPNGFLLKASDGNLYGSSVYGNFKFDMATNEVTRKIYSTNVYDSQALIEICRKPSYQFFDTAVFTICPDMPFMFDIHNNNATEYVWKKGSIVLSSQTTGVLNIENITPDDTGIYTCTMTNECGTTITMPLQITVDCLGLEERVLNDAVKLYPNPTANLLNFELTGNQNFDVQEILISNMLGQTVYKSNGKILTVDISFLNTGMYQVVLVTDKGNWNSKFIKK